MYGENEPKLCTISHTEIAAMATKKQDSLRAVAAKLEGAASSRDERTATYIKGRLSDIRGQIDGLEFLKAHLSPFDHVVSVRELADIRGHLMPVDADSFDVRPALTEYQGNALATKEACDVASGRLW